MILDLQASATRYGTKVVERLSADLRDEFPEMRGLGRRNMHYMRAFRLAWPDIEVVQRVVAQLPWGHNVELLDGLKDTDERLWYAERAYEHGWARSVLSHHIETKLRLWQGAATTNFDRALPAPESDLVRQLLKDPYHLEFLDVTEEAAERDIESALMRHVQRFLLELGRGFAFVGRQYLLDVGGDELTCCSSTSRRIATW